MREEPECNIVEVSKRVKEIVSKLDQDIADLGAFAKERGLFVQYDQRTVPLKQRLNDEWLTYPRIGLGYIGDKLEDVVCSAINNTKDKLDRDIAYHFKFKPNTDKLFQVKVTSFRQLPDIRLYLERKHNISFPYISKYQDENDIIIKKFKNGNVIVQLTEEVFNILKNYDRNQ